MLTRPRVAIIVVNWDSYARTALCLESLDRLTYAERDVILVDNGSTDGSWERLAMDFPAIRTVRNATNQGFSGGVNEGIRLARELGHDYYLLLNNDTMVGVDLLERLLEVAEADSRIAGLCPLILRLDPPQLPWYAGGHFNWWICESRPLATRNPVLGERPCDVNFLTGCAMLLRAQVVDRLGPFDDRFFAYFEDVDYTARMRRAGYRTVYVPAAQVWHEVSASVAGHGAGNLIRRYVYRNRLLLMHKHARASHWVTFLPVYLVYHVGLRLAAYAVLRRWDRIQALLAGVRDYFRVRHTAPGHW